MKKKIFTLLCIMMFTSTLAFAAGNKYANSDLSRAIQMYKGRNYTECYSVLNSVIKKDPSNALAYYYLAMTDVQMGKKDEAIANYDKAISLANNNGKLVRYANFGKNCLENADACVFEKEISDIERFIKEGNFSLYSEEARSEIEKLKIENLMRDINRSQDITPQRFKEYKDFSSMNNDTPSNDEIVAALRTLQQAGLGVGSFYNSGSPELSLLMNGNDNMQGSLYNQLSNTSLSPQVIQALLTNNMSLGF